jgi:hypothetical protein
MKKLLLILLVSFMSVSLQAQLSNTRWKGRLKGDYPRSVILDFKTNNFNIYMISDSSMVERMTYTITGNELTVKKVDGQSDCDNTVTGKYQFRIKKDSMVISKLSDECYDRSSAFDQTKWVKWKDQPEVKVAESVLKQYTGVYAMDDQHQIFITLEKGRLQAEGPR